MVFSDGKPKTAIAALAIVDLFVVDLSSSARRAKQTGEH